MQDTIEREEKIPIDQVTNFPEVIIVLTHDTTDNFKVIKVIE